MVLPLGDYNQIRRKEKKMRKKGLYIVAIVIVLVFIMAAIFAIAHKPAEVPKEGAYKTIYDVDGISFMANTNILSRATAVSEISENMDIERDMYYVYKDQNTYLFFCLNEIVIAAQKGTAFHFGDYEAKEDAVENSSIAGLWFQVNGNKLEYEDKNPFIANVNGGLVISNELYADYIGQMAVVSDGNTEWALYVGVPGLDTKFKDLSSNTRSSISTIAKSLVLSNEKPVIEEDTYEVVVNSGVSNVNEEPTENEDVIETADLESVKINSETETETESITDNPSIEESSEEIPETIVIVEETEEPTENVSEESSDEETDTKETTVEITEETIEEELTEIEDEDSTESSGEDLLANNSEEKEPVTPTVVSSTPINLNNQKKTLPRTSDKAYTSDIYAMLNLKDNGIIEEFDKDTREIVKPIINVQRVYKGQTAIKMIKDYCNNHALYNYFDAPLGCSWHIAEYYLSYEGCNTTPYIDMKLKGLDGEVLKFKGITYGKRCYDMFHEVEKVEDSDFMGPYYCYYAVPNGCSEYALECGTGNIDYASDSKAAYYLIRIK